MSDHQSSDPEDAPISVDSSSESDNSEAFDDPFDPNRHYKIEKILAARNIGGQRKYLIKWQDYDSSFNTWEPARNFDDQSLITEFEAKKEQELKNRKKQGKKRRKRKIQKRDEESTSSAKGDHHEPAPKCGQEVLPNKRVKRILGLIDDSESENGKDFGYVALLRDGSLSKITKKEGHETYPVKVIKFYQKRINWAPSSFKPTKRTSFGEALMAAVPKKPKDGIEV